MYFSELWLNFQTFLLLLGELWENCFEGSRNHLIGCSPQRACDTSWNSGHSSAFSCWLFPVQCAGTVLETNLRPLFGQNTFSVFVGLVYLGLHLASDRSLLAHENWKMLVDFSTVWQFALFRIRHFGCKGAVVLCILLLLQFAPNPQFTALASRALLLCPLPVASWWEPTRFTVCVCSGGCTLMLLLSPTFSWGSSSLLLFHLHSFHLCCVFGWRGKYVAGRGCKDQRCLGDLEIEERQLMHETRGVTEGTVGGHHPKGKRNKTLFLRGRSSVGRLCFPFPGVQGCEPQHTKCLPCSESAGNRRKNRAQEKWMGIIWNAGHLHPRYWMKNKTNP